MLKESSRPKQSPKSKASPDATSAAVFWPSVLLPGEAIVQGGAGLSSPSGNIWLDFDNATNWLRLRNMTGDTVFWHRDLSNTGALQVKLLNGTLKGINSSNAVVWALGDDGPPAFLQIVDGQNQNNGGMALVPYAWCNTDNP